MADSSLKITIEIDLEPFKKAWDKLCTDVRQIAQGFDYFVRLLTGQVPQPDEVDLDDFARQQYGPGNTTADGEWLSDMCAGWIHESCPRPDLCDCRCHQ